MLRLLNTKPGPSTSILKTSNGSNRWSFLATLPGFENYRATATGYLEHLGFDSGYVVAKLPGLVSHNCCTE